MKPLLSEADYLALDQMAKDQGSNELLNNILQSSRVVPEKELPSKTVRINSLVMVWHSFLKKVVRFRIVHPKLADLGSRHISAFSPISLALLGRHENDDVHITIGGLKKQLKIIKVSNT
jgi:transcription elongation GreA/GreB family factor